MFCCGTEEEVQDAKQLFNEAGNDAEMKEMARAEIKDLEAKQEEIEERLVVLMLPQVKTDIRELITSQLIEKLSSLSMTDLSPYHLLLVGSIGW